MADLTNEINEMMGQSYTIPDDVDEADLMAELDALETDLAMEDTVGAAPSYLQVGLVVFCVGPTTQYAAYFVASTMLAVCA